jgi:hypothetical protein
MVTKVPTSPPPSQMPEQRGYKRVVTKGTPPTSKPRGSPPDYDGEPPVRMVRSCFIFLTQPCQHFNLCFSPTLLKQTRSAAKARDTNNAAGKVCMLSVRKNT